jgi:hypothetical protein
MTATELLPLLEGVRTRGSGKWVSRCPSHKDKSPSLTVAEGDRGLLLKCWAGCTLEDITRTLRLSVKDLFYKADLGAAQLREAKRIRAEQQAITRAAYDATGRRMDALRHAEYLIRSAHGLSIESWSDQQLDAALDGLYAAYALLESEAA